MSKSYRPYEPDQMLLMPPTLNEWLPEGHLAYFVSDAVETLDLTAILSVYEAEERGYPPYHPVMMTKVMVYGYCIGVASSRKIERRLVEDVAFRILAANNTPDFRTIAEFRRRHLKALRLCQEAGLVKLGHVALDGTKMKANGSKHKAMSYERMGEEEKRLQAEVDRLLREAEEADKREDERYGPDRRGDELPEELSRRESRLRKIREAKAALERKAKDEAQPPSKDKPQGPGAVPLMEQVVAHAGVVPERASMDAGYFSAETVDGMAALGCESFIPPNRLKHGEVSAPAPRGRIPQGLSLADRMRRKLRTKRGRAIYARRKAIVEPVFGQIKHARGFRQFLLRGIEKVRGEWALICLGHNLLKLWRASAAGPPILNTAAA